MNDIVVFGATGFVGRLVAGYLAAHAPRSTSTIALAGPLAREARAGPRELGRAAADWPLVVADSARSRPRCRRWRTARGSCAPPSGRTAAAASTLVDACIAEGAHYLDLTGEILFAHESVQRHDAAGAAGVRIVHSCGFDSIPSDLGVLLLHRAAGELGDTTLVVAAMKGGFSGGTLASMKGQIDELRSDQAARRVRRRPLRAQPRRTKTRGTRPAQGHQRDPRPRLDRPVRDGDLQHPDRPPQPFLLGYGPDFRYREVVGLRHKSPVRRVGFDRRARRARRRPRLRADPQAAGPACSPTRARARGRTPAAPASSGSRSTARATSPRSPPRAIRATPRPR